MKSPQKRCVLFFAAYLQFFAAPLIAADLDAAFAAAPAAAGSLSPQLVSDGDGNLLMSWLEPIEGGFALRFSRWDDSHWETPVTVASGSNWFVNWADFPSVVPIADEFWVAHWLVRRPAGGYAYDILVAISNDGGATWGDGFRPHDDDTDTEHGFVSIYATGTDAGIIWLDGRNSLEKGGGMTLRAATLAADGSIRDAQHIDGLVCDCCQTDAAAIDEDVIVAYRDRTEGEIRDIYVTRKQGGNWTTGETVANDHWKIAACPVNGPALAISGNNSAIAWFTAVDDKPRVRLSRSSEKGSSFGAPINVIDGDTLGRVGLALLNDGSAVVSALVKARRNAVQLTLTRVDAEGRQHAPVLVANNVQPRSVPQLVLHDNALFSAWTIRENGVTEIKSARIPLTALGYTGIE